VTAVEILQRFLGTLPEGHHDYQGVRRAIEVLRAEAPANVRVVDRSFVIPRDHEERLNAARARSAYELGDPSWAGVILDAYLRPDENRVALQRDTERRT